MKTTLLALLALLVLSIAQAWAAGSARQAIPPGSALYVEPFSGDSFSMQARLENQLMEYGYRVVSRPDTADFLVRWSYTHGASTYATVRVVSPDDQVLYVQEGKNPGFGTIINKVGSTWGCIRRAMDGLAPSK